MSAHCKDPGRCSVCLATPFQRVEVRDGITYVDGVPVRAAQPEQHGQYTNSSGTQPARRGRGKR